jgi:DNA-binding transcriptional regulator YiaG
MRTTVGQQIARLRFKMNMTQTEFGELFSTTPMSISRWERDMNLPSSHELLKLGLLALKAGQDGWAYWRLAGIKRDDAQAMLR